MMIKQAMAAIGEAMRKLFSNWGTLLLALLLYGLWIGAIYLFLTTREATTLQVVLSLGVYPLLALLLFFTLQALGLSAVRVGVGPGYKLKRALKDCWKILLISLPILLLLWLTIRGADWLEQYLVRQIYSAETPTGKWKLTLVEWAETFLLYFVFPLWAIHWWMIAVREGVWGAVKATGRVLLRAFAPGSVLIYVLVVAVFGGLAWLCFFKGPRIGDEWLELYLFGGRVVLGLILVFLGWLVTLGAMAEWTARHEMAALERPTEQA